jgi:hypothetical protein
MLPHGASLIAITPHSSSLMHIGADATINAVLWPSVRDKLITGQNGQNPIQPALLIQEMEANMTVHPGLVSFFASSYCLHLKINRCRTCSILLLASYQKASFVAIRESDAVIIWVQRLTCYPLDGLWTWRLSLPATNGGCCEASRR